MGAPRGPTAGKASRRRRGARAQARRKAARTREATFWTERAPAPRPATGRGPAGAALAAGSCPS
eukprot:1250556-Pyramimonas_sp.AAC.1